MGILVLSPTGSVTSHRHVSSLQLFPLLSKEAFEEVTSESYLVLALGGLGGCSKDEPFLLPAPHCLQEMSRRLGEPLSSVGKLLGGWEEENKQWLSGFSRQA